MKVKLGENTRTLTATHIEDHLPIETQHQLIAFTVQKLFPLIGKIIIHIE